MLLLFCLIGSARAGSWCNAYTCGMSACADSSECQAVSSGTYCAMWCNSFTLRLSSCAGCEVNSPQPIAYTYTTGVLLSPGTEIKTYTKIKSQACGYADLTGAILSDPAMAGIQLYGFYDGTAGAGYVIDTDMDSPEKCQNYCAITATCGQWYFQYEYTDSARMAPAAPAWMSKCQLSVPFAEGCGSVFEIDSNDYDEYAGRVSAAGQKTSSTDKCVCTGNQGKAAQQAYYPLEMGNSCDAWDAKMAYCAPDTYNATHRSWCDDPWCYTSSECTGAARGSYFADIEGPTLYYNYIPCGSADVYSGTDSDPNA